MQKRVIKNLFSSLSPIKFTEMNSIDGKHSKQKNNQSLKTKMYFPDCIIIFNNQDQSSVKYFLGPRVTGLLEAFQFILVCHSWFTSPLRAQYTLIPPMDYKSPIKLLSGVVQGRPQTSLHGPPLFRIIDGLERGVCIYKFD